MGSPSSPRPPLASETASRALDERSAHILAFEEAHSTQSGVKDDAIRAEFGLSAARYYQLLNALIDSPAAIIHDPQLVRRLQRVRDARIGTRTMMRPDAHRR